MNVAGTGAGSSTDIYPMFLNEVMRTKFKVITGYLGSQETIIAIERGEVDGRCGWGWSSLKSTKPDWVRDKKITYPAPARARTRTRRSMRRWRSTSSRTTRPGR